MKRVFLFLIYCFFDFLVCLQTVAGFDRHLAGATHKFWLKRRLSDLSEAIFGSDFWRAFYDLQTTAPHAFTTLKTKT